MTSKAAFRLQAAKNAMKAEDTATKFMDNFIETYTFMKPRYEDGMTYEDMKEDSEYHLKGITLLKEMKNKYIDLEVNAAERYDEKLWNKVVENKYTYIDDVLVNLDSKNIFAEKWWKIDICPNRNLENHSFGGFYVTVSKFLKKKCFANAEWVFEQASYEGSETPLGYGYHVHINVMYSRSFSDLLNMTVLFFKDFCEPQCVEVGRLLTREYLKNRQNYIRGIKKDSQEKHKDEKLIYDKIWREKIKIPHLLGGTTSPNSSP